MSTPNHPDKLYSDHAGNVARSRPDEVFFLSIEACPEPGSDDFGEIGGAYVHCFVQADTLRESELRALELLRERGWRPHRLEGWELIHADVANREVIEDSGFSQFSMVQEALSEGEALAFYCWDIDAADAGGALQAGQHRQATN
jgi:hypothetical protein